MRKCVIVFFCLVIPAWGLTGCGHKNAAVKRDQAEAVRNLGEAYMSEGNYTRALRELLKAEQMNPEDPYLHNDLGLVYLAKGDPDTAIEHFERALEIRSDYSPARNNLGTAFITVKQWDRAIECFMDVKDDLLYATPFYPLTNLGYVYYMKGDYDRAEHNYNEALDLKPDFPKALHGLAQVYLAKGRYEKAVRKLEQAVELAPDAPRLYLDLGRAYEKFYEYNKALNAYKKAAALAAGTSLAEEANAAADAVRNMW